MTQAATIDYPRSVVLGVTAIRDLVYSAASGTTQASVSAPSASTLLRTGPNVLVAEHTEATLVGLRVACVSGNGESTNVVAGINLGVIAESAAVLLDSNWTAVDAAAAWTMAVGRGGTWVGWENCGVKPEGTPSPSSRFKPQSDGSYVEDIYDGNPSTTFNIITRSVSATAVAAMLSDDGRVTTEDPTRPLRVTLRAYRDLSGNTIFIEVGTPIPGAPAAARGFIALYVWT